VEVRAAALLVEHALSAVECGAHRRAHSDHRRPPAGIAYPFWLRR
jgi:hypothetical protein